MHIICRVWDVGPTYSPTKGTAVHWCVCRRWIPYLMWKSMLWGQHFSNPSTELLWWPEDLGLLQWSDSIVWYTDGSKMLVGAGARVYGQSWRMRLTISPGKFATLACAYKIQMNAMPQKYVSICSDSQVALRDLQAAKRTSPLVRQWTTFSPSILWDCFESSGILGYVEMKLPSGLQGREPFTQFVGPGPALQVSRQNTRKIERWTDNHPMAMWRGLTSTQRQLQKLISGPNPTATTRLLSFHRIRSEVVTGLLTEHNTLRRHLYILGFILCRRCEAEEET
jgi:hypothetical protein